MLWGTSSLALYIPWARTAGPYLGISLWLWLGVLDAVQGVGLGMILLQVCLIYFGRLNTILTYWLDTFASPRLCDTRIRANHWIRLCHGCSGHRTEPRRSGKCVPGCCQMGLLRRAQRYVQCSSSDFRYLLPRADSPMASPAFWVALVCQLIIVFGYFWFYRKEQLCTFLLSHPTGVS
jgi:alpha-1,3-glucan synthase